MKTDCLPIALSKAIDIPYEVACDWCGYVEGQFIWPFKALIRLINERYDVVVIDDMDLRETPLETAISSFNDDLEVMTVFKNSNMEEAIKDSKLVEWDKLLFIKKIPTELDIACLMDQGYKVMGMVDIDGVYHMEYLTIPVPCVYVIGIQ